MLLLPRSSCKSTLLACLLLTLVAHQGHTQTAAEGADSGGVPVLDSVDQPVQIQACPRPEYPTSRADHLAMVRVELRYIIDTLGFPEPESIQLIGQRPSVEFREPAIDAIRRCRFRPAMHRGRKVRQLVEQAVAFYPESYPGPPRSTDDFPW